MLKPPRGWATGSGCCRGGLAGPRRADRGPTLPARQRSSLYLGAALTATVPTVPAELRRLLAPPATPRTTLPPGPHNNRPLGRLRAGRPGPGTDRGGDRPTRPPQRQLEPGRVQARPARRRRLLEADQVRAVLLAAGYHTTKAQVTIASGPRAGVAKPARVRASEAPHDQWRLLANVPKRLADGLAGSLGRWWRMCRQPWTWPVSTQWSGLGGWKFAGHWVSAS